MIRELGMPIAAGNEAELFAWDGGRVLKLSRRVGDPTQAEREASILSALAPTGLVPRQDGVIEVNGRWGIVMERIDQPTLASAMADPGLFPELLDLVVTLHRRIHAVRAPEGLQHLKQRLGDRIDGAERLSRERRDKLLKRLGDMPDGDRLCHGDFHPFNILGLDQQARVIDWLDATRGDPVADVCRTYVLMSAYDPGIAAAYVDAYGIDRAEIEAWLPLVAAGRLTENVPDEFERLTQLAQGGRLG